MQHRPIVLACALLAAWPLPAAAEVALDLSANVGLVSDYRFRGLSLSDRDPAFQGGVDVNADIGLFAGAWGSTIADYGGAGVEVDFYGGYNGSAAGFDYALTASAYLYPGGTDVNYLEFRLDGAREIGPVTLGAELSYVPRQRNTGTANHYVGASMGLAVPGAEGLAATVRGGREQGFYEGKWDWELGLAYTRGALAGSIAYVDSN